MLRVATDTKRETGTTAKPQNKQPILPGFSKQPRYKATFHLSREDVAAIDTMVTDEFLRTGKRIEKSEIASRAIRELYARREKPGA